MYYLMQEKMSCGCELTYHYVRLFATPFLPIFMEIEDSVTMTTKGKAIDPCSNFLIKIGRAGYGHPGTTTISSDVTGWTKENETSFDYSVNAPLRRTVKNQPKGI